MEASAKKPVHLARPAATQGACMISVKRSVARHVASAKNHAITNAYTQNAANYVQKRAIEFLAMRNAQRLLIAVTLA